MFSLNRYPVSEDMQEWIISEFLWAAKNGLLTTDTPLVTPTKAFFPTPSGTPEDIARGIIGNLLAVLGRANEQIGLLPLDRPAAEYRAAGAFEQLGETAGAWTGDGDGSVIFYDPEAVARPLTMISTLVHEVMHHILNGVPSGRADPLEEEMRTDLHCITTGFGLLQVLGAEQAGWQGYMRQPTRLYALALFLEVRVIEPEAAQSRLSGRMKRGLIRAIRVVKTHQNRIEEIQAEMTPALMPVSQT